MIFCVHNKLSDRRDYLSAKCGYTINKIPVDFGMHSYLVQRPCGYVLAWIGADVPDCRKVAIRACLDDIAAESQGKRATPGSGAKHT